AERYKITLTKDVTGDLDARQLLVRVDRCPAVPRKMLGAGKHALRLTGIDPRRGGFTNTIRIAAKRSGADDWVVGLDVEIAVGSVDPVDSQLAGLARRDRSGATHCLQIFERGNRRQWWQRRLSGELLAGAALEIRPDQQRRFRF